eukprot:33590_1
MSAIFMFEKSIGVQAACWPTKWRGNPDKMVEDAVDETSLPMFRDPQPACMTMPTYRYMRIRGKVLGQRVYANLPSPPYWSRPGGSNLPLLSSGSSSLERAVSPLLGFDIFEWMNDRNSIATLD